MERPLEGRCLTTDQANQGRLLLDAFQESFLRQSGLFDLALM